MLASALDVPAWYESPYPRLARDFLSETVKRVRRRLRGAPAPPLKGERVESRRLIKGLRPKL